MNRLSLFQKISLGLIAQTLTAGFLIAWILFTVYDRFEISLLNNTTQHDLDTYLSLLSNDPQSLPLTSDRLFFLKPPEALDSLPKNLQSLQPGFYHEISINGIDYHVAVRDTQKGRAIMALDIHQLETTEAITSSVVVAGILFISLLSSIVIALIARRIIKPVSKLAQEVQNLEPTERNFLFSDTYRDYEVGLIARAFERFFSRLDEYILREQSFTATASHEFRTPLAVIQTSAEILEQDKNLSELSRQSLNKIKRSTMQLTDLVDSLLFLARGTSGNPDSIIQTPTDISKLLTQITEEHRSSFHQHPVTLVTDIPPDIKKPVSETHLRMVVNNLITNAFQHTETGTVSISLRNEHLSISDTGRGIDPAELDHIFEKNFSRHFNDGIGLGLYICKQVCDAYAWNIQVNSTIGSGSEFKVVFNKENSIQKNNNTIQYKDQRNIA